jgi:L-amino acid N-acyltransferase YncA
MNVFHSKGLQYRSFNSPEDDDFFHSMQSDPLTFTNSCVSLTRPVGRRFTKNIRKHLTENSLLFVVIYRISDYVPDYPVASRMQPRVWVQAEPERIGIMFLKSASPDMAHHRCSECGIDMKKQYQSQYGGLAIKWMLDWAFRSANMHRVECNVFGWNTGIVEIYKRAGFFEEGKRRECLFKDDKWWDEVHLGILKEEWQLIRQ